MFGTIVFTNRPKMLEITDRGSVLYHAMRSAHMRIPWFLLPVNKEKLNRNIQDFPLAAVFKKRATSGGPSMFRSSARRTTTSCTSNGSVMGASSRTRVAPIGAASERPSDLGW